MDFGLSEEQEMLRKMARDFLTNECPKKLVREMEEDEKGYSPELWRKMAELGWQGLVIPEKYGGGDGSFLDLAVLMEEMGRSCLPGPFFSTVVLGSLAILEAGNDDQKQKFLPPIGEGKLIITLALTEPSAGYTPAAVTVKATAEQDYYIINGTKLFISDAHIADWLICVARTKEAAKPEEGITLFLVDAKDPGISYTVLKTIAADRQCEVIFNNVKVPGANILGKPDQGWAVVNKILQRAAVAKCAEMVGGAQEVLDMTTSYAKERVQFDRPIGSFQAIQHYCANMAIDVDGSRFATYQAAWMIAEGLPCTKEVAIAKGWSSDAYRRVTAISHQIHGGVGFTLDHDLQLYYRRAKAAEVFVGDADFQREVIAQELGL